MANKFKILNNGKAVGHTETAKQDGTFDIGLTGLTANTDYNFDIVYVDGGEPETATFKTKETVPTEPETPPEGE